MEKVGAVPRTLCSLKRKLSILILAILASHSIGVAYSIVIFVSTNLVGAPLAVASKRPQGRLVLIRIDTGRESGECCVNPAMWRAEALELRWRLGPRA